MSDDLDPISDLQGRLARLETSLAHVRTGQAPPKPVDLLAWRANDTQPTASWWHTLREDWQGLSEAIRDWAIRFEARLGR